MKDQLIYGVYSSSSFFVHMAASLVGRLTFFFRSLPASSIRVLTLTPPFNFPSTLICIRTRLTRDYYATCRRRFDSLVRPSLDFCRKS